jgi:hypothetical protein
MLIDEPLVQGLPRFIRLSGELRLALLVPTGLIRPWLDADPSLVVSSSAREIQPRQPTPDEEPHGWTAQPAARIVLMDRNTPVACAGLTAGRPITLPESGAAGVRVSILVLDWDLRAGSLRGPGNFGSHIRLAWRAADAATSHFSTPPVNPVLVKRLPPKFRIESRLGLIEQIKLRRFIDVGKKFYQ